MAHWIGRLLLACGLILAGSAVVAAPARADVVAGPPAPIAADDGAHVLWSNRPDGADGRTLDLLISSPAVGIAKWARILLPVGWTPEATTTYPVLYLLHGGGDPNQSRSWTVEDTDPVNNVGTLTEHTGVIVVMPDGGMCDQYTNWYNGGQFGTPAWETFHLVELRQVLERNFHAGTQRAVAGMSMGGLGAMTYAARNPGLFAAAASFSGSVDPLINYPVVTAPDAPFTGPASIQVTVATTCPNNNWKAIWGDPAVTTSPAAGAPAPIDYWHQHNPTDLAGQLTGVQLFVSTGDGTCGPLDDAGCTGVNPLEKQVEVESRQFVNALINAKVPVTTDFYGPGSHRWPYWDRELGRAFPMLMAAIGAQPI
jgi:S-formylglutathione hydrolase FrmB